MNELSIAHDLLKDLKIQSERHGVSSVSRVHVRIGSLRTIVPEVLTFAFEEEFKQEGLVDELSTSKEFTSQQWARTQQGA